MKNDEEPLISAIISFTEIIALKPYLIIKKYRILPIITF